MSNPSSSPPGAAFRRQDGLKAGLRKHCLDGPDFQSVFPSVRISSTSEITTRVRADAALLLSHATAVVSHHTAARLWGGVVPHDDDVHVSVREANHRTRRAGIRSHVRSREDGRGLTTRGSLRITDPLSTFTDLAADLDLVDLVVLGDSLVKARRFNLEQLREAVEAWHGPGAVLARRAAALVRADVDSPMETRLRLLLVFAGLPEPTVNIVLRDEDGHIVYRLDLAFAQVKVAVEYDGRQHAEDTRQWGQDLTRREDLDGLGWRLIVCRAADVYNTPAQTVARVVSALCDRGMQLDPKPQRLMRRHFPGRPARTSR